MSCHLSSHWGADGRPLSPDARGRVTERHSQTVFDVAALPALRWRADRLRTTAPFDRFLEGDDHALDARQTAGLLAVSARGGAGCNLARTAPNFPRTAPYFHDGSVESLREAVRIMAAVQLGIDLPSAELDAIVALLESHTGDAPPRFAPPGCAQPCGRRACRNAAVVHRPVDRFR